MKKILVWTLLIVGTVFLTKYANDAAQDIEAHGATFRLTKQQAISCGNGQITLAGPDGPTRLLTDGSCPACSSFDANQYYDFWLARGGRTGFINVEKSPWWRTGK